MRPVRLRLESLSHSLLGFIYRHYKGNNYFAYGIARHSETEESLVVYVPLKSNAPATTYPSGNLWVRPVSMFNETVDTGEAVVPRFEFISELDEESQGLNAYNDNVSIRRRILRFFSRSSN